MISFAGYLIGVGFGIVGGLWLARIYDEEYKINKVKELEQAILDIDSWIDGVEGIGILYCYDYGRYDDESDLKSIEIVKKILGEKNGY